MKLIEADKQTLREWGHLDCDMEQLQRAAIRCKYEGKNDECLDAEDVIKMLGRITWLSGISRAAFHGSAVRDNNGHSVYFDCYEMFNRFDIKGN